MTVVIAMISRGVLHAGTAPLTNEIARDRMTGTAVIMTDAGGKPGIPTRVAEDIGTTGEAEAGGNGVQFYLLELN